MSCPQAHVLKVDPLAGPEHNAVQAQPETKQQAMRKSLGTGQDIAESHAKGVEAPASADGSRGVGHAEGSQPKDDVAVETGDGDVGEESESEGEAALPSNFSIDQFVTRVHGADSR